MRSHVLKLSRTWLAAASVRSRELVLSWTFLSRGGGLLAWTWEEVNSPGWVLGPFHLASPSTLTGSPWCLASVPFCLARAAVLLPVWFGVSRPFWGLWGCLLALWVLLAMCLSPLRPLWCPLWCLQVPWVSLLGMPPLWPR